MTFKKPDRTYWDRKLAAYLHDPFDKAFEIRGHEERAARQLNAFGLQKPNEKFWTMADGIASGFERGQAPSYSKDENKNGAVDFVRDGKAVITHPIGENGRLEIDLPQKDIKAITRELEQFLLDTIGDKPEKCGFSNKYINDHDRFCVARFMYMHLALRFKLAEENVADIGALWHRLPADTRFPDHSIWQHNALVSALNSCMEMTDDENDAGLMVISITPVQAFIGTARKLRDYWSGSVLLSWLAFEGLRWVMENLGPDHVLYPSLVDQPLVNEYLEKTWDIKGINSMSKARDIASLPNKFVILIPYRKAGEIGRAIREAVNAAWRALLENSEKFLTYFTDTRLSPPELDHIRAMYQNQGPDYWDIQWGAVRLLSGNDAPEFKKLLPEIVYDKQLALLDILNEIVAKKTHYQNTGKGTLYSVSHQLLQSVLAGQKLKRKNKRAPQNGVKCSMCGEFEALHAKKHREGEAASVYNEHIREFWQAIAEKNKTEIRANERLCSICFTKRMAYRIIKSDESHILNATFSKAESFPTTTEMALYSWFEKNNVPQKERQNLVNKLHDKEEGNESLSILDKTHSRLTDKDKYYAILMMDGDKMGKLINGATIGATWESIMHPELKKRLKSETFDALYKESWQRIFAEHGKRLITPSIHAAISEALADFSLYGVHPIIEKYKGRLIYAGGDDVCAMLPLENALNAAREIQDFYVSGFKLIRMDDKENPVRDIASPWSPRAGKLSFALGKADGISISAGLLICHHKENLKQMIRQAHVLLDEKAKKEGGRDALALELRKRSGGSRFVTAKWDAPVWTNMLELQRALRTQNLDLSRSLLYSIDNYSEGITPLIGHEDNEILKRFIIHLLGKSGLDTDKEIKKELAEKISLLIKEQQNTEKADKVNSDSLIISAFLAEKEDA